MPVLESLGFIAGVLALGFLGGQFGSGLLPPLQPRISSKYRAASI
jgi:hypothetical protein